MDNDNLLPLKQVQAMLKIHYNTLNRYIKNGMLPVVTITKRKRFIREIDLNNFIQSHTGVISKEVDNNDNNTNN